MLKQEITSNIRKILIPEWNKKTSRNKKKEKLFI